MKRKLIVMACLLMSVALVFASGSKDTKAETKYHLTFSGIGGSLNYLPVYIAQQEGWFEEAGLSVDEILFTNGPVQMESLSSNSWDIGATGVGGVLSGVLGYDAILLGSSNSDNGTQYVFARNDSPIVKAGTGHNTVGEKIYGDADSWKGAKILCNTGSVLHYLLNTTLSGFGLTGDDVTFMAMDVPTAFSAFLAGEGDAVVLTGSAGTFQMLSYPEYTPISSGSWADTGVMCSFVVNKNSYNDPEKYEALKIFFDVYFDAMDWMKDHEDEAVQYLIDENDENGSSLELDVARNYFRADTFYTLEEACEMMNTKAEGKDYSVMEEKILGVLQFFIETGSYAPGDDVKFLNHMDATLLNEVLAARD